MSGQLRNDLALFSSAGTRPGFVSGAFHCPLEIEFLKSAIYALLHSHFNLV